MNTALAPAESVAASDTPVAMPSVAQPPLVLSDAMNDGRWRSWSSTLRVGVGRVQHWIRSLGPYVAIELLLPGGTIIALVLWAYRRRAASANAASANTEVAPVEAPRARLRCVTPCNQR